jgi:hypothetical protein
MKSKTDSEAHPASYPMGKHVVPLEVKAQDVQLSSPPNVEVRMRGVVLSFSIRLQETELNYRQLQPHLYLYHRQRSAERDVNSREHESDEWDTTSSLPPASCLSESPVHGANTKVATRR